MVGLGSVASYFRMQNLSRRSVSEGGTLPRLEMHAVELHDRKELLILRL
jgi:hypothetical protein